MSGNRVPSEEEILSSSTTFRAAGGTTFRRQGARRSSEWIAEIDGQTIRLSPEQAVGGIQQQARLGFLAETGRAPSPAQETRFRNERQAAETASASLTASLRRGGATTASNTRPSRPNGVTGSNAGPIRFEDAPSPSEERQEELINDVSQGPRFTRTGPRTAQSFNINSFRSEVLENDVLSTHSYLVSFSPFRAGFDENAPLTRFVTNKRNTLILRCENVVLPTSSLLEEENIRRYGYGPVEKVPYGIQFSDVTMTWLVDKNSELIEFFNQWMNTIVMHDSPNTLMRGGLKRPGLGLYSPFEIGYKDAYTNPTVKITVYNKQNETTTIYEMYDVFPMNIQAMNLSWADENELQKLTVTFAYTNMKVRAPRANDDLPQENFVASGRIPPLMERLERIDNSGGRAAADTAAPPANESTRTTAGASTPNATTAPAPAPTAARPIPSGPATRTFVGPPAP